MSLGPSLPENAHSEGESVTTRGWLERTPDNLIPAILDLVSVLELRGIYIHHALMCDLYLNHCPDSVSICLLYIYSFVT